MEAVQNQPILTNGHGGDGDPITDECSDEESSNLRPVDIEQDVRDMERRKRVEAIMTSKLFREELERMVIDHSGMVEELPSMLSDMMSVKRVGGMGSATRGGAGAMSSSVIPINDIRGFEGLGYTKAEKALRCKLASAYRLVDIFGWTQGIYNHITARLGRDTEHFLVNPFGLLYNEVTASSLVKVDMQGNIVERGTTNLGINEAAFVLHSAIHSARPDLKCIIHIHTPNVVAVSSILTGLLPISQESCLLGDISYHSYQGIVVDMEERASLASDLGVHNKVMMLRNHGAICCGETIDEALYYLNHLVLACEAQQKLISVDPNNLVLIPDIVRQKTFEAAHRSGGGGVDSLSESRDGRASRNGGDHKHNRKWGIGQMEFEALMRNLDNGGYRTGYTYRYPLSWDQPCKPRSDVELPPSVSSISHLLDEEYLCKDGPLRQFLENLARSSRNGGCRTKWMNSPNAYQKIEVLETGTNDPRTIVKWVTDETSGCTSTPIRMEDANMFVPMGTSKREFKKVQSAMKEGRRAGGLTGGPESKILDGGSLSWEEALRSQSAKSPVRQSDVEFKVGSASKGIIQRDFQAHATVYKSAYAKNPFDNISDADLVEYKRVIDAKSGGMSEEESFGVERDSSSHTLTLNRITSPTTDGRTLNGEETDCGTHTFSEGEVDTSRATDADDSVSSPSKKNKKKKSGIRTPSFLKKKKKDKKSPEQRSRHD